MLYAIKNMRSYTRPSIYQTGLCAIETCISIPVVLLPGHKFSKVWENPIALLNFGEMFQFSLNCVAE